MDYIDDLVCGRLALPAIPAVVAQIVLALKNPATSLHTVTHELEKDPALAARTLQLANSPYYGGRRSFSTISGAVEMLGTDALQQMVLTVGIASVFVEVPTVNLPQFWYRAALTARMARLFALSCRMPADCASAAYLTGLLHGVGHLMLCQAFPMQAVPHFQAQSDLHGAALVQAEQLAFGVAHTTVAAAWVGQLGFPLDIEMALRYYLVPWASEAGPLAPSLHLAVLLVEKLSAGMSGIEALDELDPAMLNWAGVHRGRLEKQVVAWERE